MAYEQEQQVAIAAVTAAAMLCETVRARQGGEAIAKQDRSPVTVADFAAQAIICRALAAIFPSDAIVAEETATMLRQPEMAHELAQITQYVRARVPDATPEAVTTWIDRGNGEVGDSRCNGNGDRYWTLDPIDGTKGFVRGDHYAIALALIEAGDIKLGILGCPTLSVQMTPDHQETGVLFLAVRGQGTQVIGLESQRSVWVDAAANLDRAIPRLIESVELEHGDPERQRAVAEAAGLTEPPLPMDSQAKYGAVACGQAALYLRLTWAGEPDYRENIWDHAAGAIVVEEAGGRVVDMCGVPLDFTQAPKLVNNRGIVASNGALFDRVLAVLD